MKAVSLFAGVGGFDLALERNGVEVIATCEIDIHAVAQPSTVRRLTPTECERLQGFPDGWTDGQTDSHRYKQMGNAVAVPVVEWIVKRLVEIDKNGQNV